jgi:hypothetical protein
MLANQALAIEDSTTTTGNDKIFHIDELLKWISQFQHGMDVNLGFRKVDAYEYSAQLTAWDMFRIQLVHGWLVDPDSAEAQVIQNHTYNVLVEKIIQARDAAAELETLEKIQLDVATTDYSSLVEQRTRIEHLQQLATQGTLMEHFLESTSHQLTNYGLQKLRDHLADEQLVVFFRNNHFSLMTKHENELYLLVTDLGYADSYDIIWERLDAIDGNTTLVNADFCVNTMRNEEEAYQMALQLSLQEQEHEQLTCLQGTTVALPPLEGPRADTEPPVKVGPQPVVAVGVPLSVSATARPAPQSGNLTRMSGNDNDTGMSMPMEPMSGTENKGVMAPLALVDADVMLARQLQADWNNESATALPAPPDGNTTRMYENDNNAVMSMPMESMSGMAKEGAMAPQPTTMVDADVMLARQLQADWNTESSTDESASLQLARQLQTEEYHSQQDRPTTPAVARPKKSQQSQNGCIVS